MKKEDKKYINSGSGEDLVLGKFLQHVLKLIEFVNNFIKLEGEVV